MGNGCNTFKVGSLHLQMTTIGKKCEGHDLNQTKALKDSVVVFDFHKQAALRVETIETGKKVFCINLAS